MLMLNAFSKHLSLFGDQAVTKAADFREEPGSWLETPGKSAKSGFEQINLVTCFLQSKVPNNIPLEHGVTFHSTDSDHLSHFKAFKTLYRAYHSFPFSIFHWPL